MNPSYEAMRVAREEKQEKLLKAARWHAVRELEKLKLDGGSHENLSSIASTVYQPYMGWTQGACEALRRHLIDLIGGEREADCVCEHPDTVGSGVRGDESEEVSDGMARGGCELREDSGDSACGCMDNSDVHQEAVGHPFAQYDVLDNERHKAVCELRKLRDDIGILNSYYEFMVKLLDKFGFNNSCWEDRLNDLCNHLIHLLGGDQIVENSENYNLEETPDE